jgi:hypothetical protein
MQILDNLAFWQWIAQVLVVFFIIGGLVGIAVGYGLFANSARTVTFLSTMNRWTSTRRAMKPVEILRNTTPVVQKYMRVIAAIFLVGGLYSLYALIAQFNTEAIIFSLKLSKVHPQISGLLIDGARWILIVGNVAAIAVGIMMAFFPDKLIALEARGSKWFSARSMTQIGDQMHAPLDRWVAASPRAAGAVITVGSFIIVVSFAFMLFAQR